VEILEAGFSAILNRYNVTQLEGRGNVEREIRTLQEAEVRGELDTLKCFIFDLDTVPTELVSTKLVRVNQWKRRCIENYLINENAIYEILRDDDISRDKIDNRGIASAICREIALTQLNDTVATIVYKQMGFGTLGPPAQKELFGKSFAESGVILFDRILKIQEQICNLTSAKWHTEFERRCEEEDAALRPQWDREWVSLCDGKRFFRDLYSRFGLRLPPVKLKVRIMERLERAHAEEWVLIESILRAALKP
jgi:hypothetical protein